jgi:hypothetical protein
MPIQKAIDKFLKLCRALTGAVFFILNVGFILLAAFIAGRIAFAIAEASDFSLWMQYSLAVVAGVLAAMLLIGWAQIVGGRR